MRPERPPHLIFLGYLAREQGETAARHWRTSKRSSLRGGLGDRFALVQAFAGLADLAVRYAQADVAAALIGVLDTLTQETGLTQSSGMGGDSTVPLRP